MLVRRQILLAALLIAVLAPAARGQVVEDTEGMTPVPLGKATLYPYYRAEFGWTDNLFYDNPNFDPTETYLVRMVPSFLFELPFSASRVRLGYAFRYQAYSEDIDSHDSNYLLADGHLEFANGLTIDFRDDFQFGVLDTKSFDAGEGSTFKGEEVDSNVGSGAIGYRSRRWEAGVLGSTNYVRFPERTVTTFYDVDGWSTGMFFRYESTPVLRWSLEADVSRSRLVIPPEGISAGSEQIEFSRGIDVGMQYDLAPGNQVRGRLGFPYYEYQSDAPAQFRTIVGQVEYSRSIPALYSATFLLLRAAYPTTFNQSNYYLDERFSFLLTNDRAARFELGGSATYYWNRYPGLVPPEGQRRKDQTIQGECYVGYRFAGGLSWRVYFRGETRYSSVELFEYGVGSIGTALILGN